MTSQKGIPKEEAAFIISLIGASNTIGRVLVGAFVDIPWVPDRFTLRRKTKRKVDFRLKSKPK